MDDTTRYARGYTRTTPPERTPRHPTERRRGGREHYDERSARTARTTRESPPLVTRRESDDGDVRIDLRDGADAVEITARLPDEEWEADVSVSASAVRVRARPADPSAEESDQPSVEESDAVERRVALTRGIAVERAMMVRSDATLTVVLPTVSA